MELFIGTKLVRAKPMTKGQYNIFRHWEMPANEDSSEPGYLVEYMDGGKPNTNKYHGYVTWSPYAPFQNAYRSTDGLSFGLANDAMKRGYKVARHGWNGKDMFIFLVPGSTFIVNRAPLLGIFPEGTEVNYQPHIDMKTADDRIVPWAPTQSDTQDTDWYIVP